MLLQSSVYLYQIFYLLTGKERNNKNENNNIPVAIKYILGSFWRQQVTASQIKNKNTSSP